MKPTKSHPLKCRRLAFLLFGILGLWTAPAVLKADPAPTVETQLRERLRDTLLQLRTAETDRATLQATQAQWADEKARLTARTEALTKQINENKLTAQVVDGLKAQVAHQEKEIADLKEAVASSRQAADLAHTRETERATHADEAMADLERLVADRQAKNLALYKIASEILDRYQKFSLGDALKSREPFVGITRVKLQNQVQDYQDKLSNERTTLTEKDLKFHQDKVLNQPLQISKPGASQQPSE